MKTAIKKIKASLTALGVAILTLFTKTMGQYAGGIPAMYGVEYKIGGRPVIPEPEPTINIVLKIAQRVLVGVIFIIGIINIIKLRKIDNKVQEKKKIKRNVIIIIVLLAVLLLSFLVSELLLKK